jgi:hypothetical protein
VRPLLTLLLAAGCTPSLEGDWYGTCAFSDASYGYSGALSVKVANGRGQRLDGRVGLDMFDGRSFQGDMTGLRSDSYVEMAAPLQGGDAGRFLFELTGEVEDDGSIEGTCALRLDEGGAGLTGDVVLERP